MVERKKCLGIDIGAGSIKVAELVADKEVIRITRLIEEELKIPEGATPEEIHAAVVEMLKGYGIEMPEGAPKASSPSASPGPRIIAQSRPNPFNPETTISYSLPQNSSVKLVIYNVLGQPVRTLFNKFQKSGNHISMWDGKDAINRPVPSGIYLCKLTAGSHQKIIKLTLSK